MDRSHFKMVTRDPLPILFIILVMTGSTFLILATVMVLNSRLDVSVVSKFFTLAVPGLTLIGIGLRRRLVWVDEQTGEVVITWGNRFPLPIHRYSTRSIIRTQINREQRYLVTPIPGGPVRTSRVPDRWRLLGFLQTGKKANLGSYTTEAEAQAVANTVLGVK